MADIKNKYKFIIFDMDSTLFDFLKSEKIAFEHVSKKYYKSYKEEYYKIYTGINSRYWLDYQNGKVTKDYLKQARFSDTARKIAELEERTPDDFDAGMMSEEYIDALANAPILYDGAAELVQRLSLKYKLGIITNGIKRNQLSRLKLSGMYKYFDFVIISEDIGKPKPDIAMFNACKSAAGSGISSEYLVIGDSFNADIKGGNDAGMDTMYIDMSINSATAKERFLQSEIKPAYFAGNYKSIINQLI